MEVCIALNYDSPQRLLGIMFDFLPTLRDHQVFCPLLVHSRADYRRLRRSQCSGIAYARPGTVTDKETIRREYFASIYDGVKLHVESD